MKHKKISGTAAVVVGVLLALGATACTGTSSAEADRATKKPTAAGKNTDPAVSADSAESAERKQADIAASVLMEGSEAGFLLSSSGGFRSPSADVHASLASGTRVAVQVACSGTGKLTVHLASGAASADYAVSRTFTCNENSAATHQLDYRLTEKGLTVAFDAPKAAKGGYAYVVRKV